MPKTTVFTGGVSNGFSVAVQVPLPSIEGEASAIDLISVLRGSGRLLTDGDLAMIGLSHQSDLLTTDLADDPDDFITDLGFDIWWVDGLSETDHDHDRIDPPELVAGPQTMVFHNGTGALAAARLDISWHVVSVPNLTRWALLKQLTSYER